MRALALVLSLLSAAQLNEKDATAKAQAVILAGGPAALVEEFANELSDQGRFEDRVIQGNYGAALKNFPQEAALAFKKLDFEIQLNLLLSSWDRFAFPAMAPVLRALYQSPPDDSARLRDIALRRLYQLDARLTRPFMLNELQRGDLRVSMTTLGLLPDAAFPEFEEAWVRALEHGVLDERIDAAVRLERFGSPAQLTAVNRIVKEQGRRWSCDVRVATANYLARVDAKSSSAQAMRDGCH
jgi:hypothetical protein